MAPLISPQIYPQKLWTDRKAQTLTQIEWNVNDSGRTLWNSQTFPEELFKTY